MDDFEYLFEKLWDDEGTLLAAGDTVCLNGEKTEIGRTSEGLLFFMIEPEDGIIQSLKLGPCDKRPGSGGSDSDMPTNPGRTARSEVEKI